MTSYGLRPCRRLVLHALASLAIINDRAPFRSQVAALLQAEYTAEEMAVVPLKQPEELTVLLDALS